MSLDRRLREGIDRLTADLDPDVERHLHTSLRTGRRRVRVRRAGAALGIAAAVALVVVAGPRLLDALKEPSRPADRPSPTPIVTATIAGTYTVTVDPGPAVVDEQGLAGEWTIRLHAHGAVEITAPAGFTGSFAGYLFRVVDGRLFETDAFVNDLCNEAQGAGQPKGIYRLELRGNDLFLQTQDDICEARMAIFDAILRAE